MNAEAQERQQGATVMEHLSWGRRLARHLVVPFIWTWFLAGLLHVLHVVHVREIVASPIVISFCFLPIVLMDTMFTKRWADPVSASAQTTPPMLRRILSANSLIWLVIFCFWVLLMGHRATLSPWFRWFGPEIYFQVWLVCAAQGWKTLVALSIWAIGLGVMMRLRGRFRIFWVLLLPGVLSLGLFADLLILGGRGAADLDQILAQPGIELELDPRTLHIEGFPPPEHGEDGAALRCHLVAEEKRGEDQTLAGTPEPPPEVLHPPLMWHPRDVCVDGPGDVLFASYGRSWFADKNRVPIVVRIDRKQGGIACFREFNQHHFGCRPGGDTLWVGPWVLPGKIYGLSKEDLTLVKKLSRPNRRWLRHFHPIQVLEDWNGERLYVGTELEGALVAYDLAAGKLAGVLKLPEEGYIRWGAPLHFIVQSKTTRRLYFTSGPGLNLFEADPDRLKVLRTLALGDVVGTSIALDENGGYLFYQSGAWDSLYRIRLDTFEVENEFEGELHARRMLFDSARNALYLLGYMSGTLIALDANTGQRRWEVAVGARPHGLTQSGSTLWVNSFSGILRLDLKLLWQRADATSPKPL